MNKNSFHVESYLFRRIHFPHARLRDIPPSYKLQNDTKPSRMANKLQQNDTFDDDMPKNYYQQNDAKQNDLKQNDSQSRMTHN